MIYSIHNTQLKRVEQQVFHHGKPLKLSTRGHTCLLLFLQSNHNILTKDALMDALWPNVVVSDDSLFKVIQEVRLALKSTGLDTECIVNVYSKGYQFKPPIRVIEPSAGGRRWWLVALVLTLFIAVAGVAWFSQTPSMRMNDAMFDEYLNRIESDYVGTEALNFGNLTGSQHPQDRLRLGYLRGYALYKSGQYDQSIDFLLQAVQAYTADGANAVYADANLLLAKMHIYRDDKSALKTFLDRAESQYRVLGDRSGLISTAIERARYHQVMQAHDQAIELLDHVLDMAVQSNDAYNQMRVHSNLAYSYERTGQAGLARDAHETTLKLALSLPDPRYAAYAYGALSEVLMSQGDAEKAMNYAVLALKYVLAQKDTNLFQQGYSYFYLLLPQLGHWQLAEQHLRSAMDVQAAFNPQGRLIAAELQLAKVKVALHKYSEAHALLLELLAQNLAEPERLQAEALLALTAAQRGDNIGAYAKAKMVLAAQDLPLSDNLIASVALVRAAHALEKHREADEVYAMLLQQVRAEHLFEYRLFLALSEWLYSEVNPDDEKLKNTRSLLLKQIDQLALLHDITQPEAELMRELSDYLGKIQRQ